MVVSIVIDARGPAFQPDPNRELYHILEELAARLRLASGLGIRVRPGHRATLRDRDGRRVGRMVATTS